MANQATSNIPWLSVVVPIYNEEDNIPELLTRLMASLEQQKQSWEILFVNDGSSDRSLELLKAAAEKDSRIFVLELTRNFGQHSAVFCAFERVRGQFIVTIDADLQNPPEEIAKIVQKGLEGYDCVATIRQNRQDTAFRKTASRIVNRATRHLTGIQLHDFGCMLRGYSRQVVDAMVHTKEISTFIPALGASFAGKTIEIEVAHSPRFAGQSKYSFFKLISLHFDLMTSFSLKPIRFLTFFGLAVAGLSAAFGLLLLILRLFYGAEWSQFGTFTLFAVLFFFIGAQFVVLGLLGEYIARIYAEVRDRPRFIVRKIHGKETAGQPQNTNIPISTHNA